MHSLCVLTATSDHSCSTSASTIAENACISDSVNDETESSFDDMRFVEHVMKTTLAQHHDGKRTIFARNTHLEVLLESFD